MIIKIDCADCSAIVQDKIKGDHDQIEISFSTLTEDKYTIYKENYRENPHLIYVSVSYKAGTVINAGEDIIITLKDQLYEHYKLAMEPKVMPLLKYE